jgi:hypothetical protein
LRGVINRGLAEQIRETFLGRILGLGKGKARKSKEREEGRRDHHRSIGFIIFFPLELFYSFILICALAMIG